MRRTVVPLIIMGSLCAAAACTRSPDLEFADWVFPVAEGTPVKEYAPVPMRDRAEDAFELIEDLVIGGDPDDPETAFYRPTDVLAAANGNIFVVDSGNARVQMFGADGSFLKTLGQRGQGPGEFQLPTGGTIAGDLLIVSDMRNSRFSVWTDTGEHVADHATPLGFQASQMAGLAGGGMIIFGPQANMGGITAGVMPVISNVLASYSAEGEQLVSLIETTMPSMGNPMELMNDPVRRMQYTIDMTAVPRPRFAVAGDTVYVSPASEYQVIAMDSSGAARWALRVAWPRPRVSQDSKQRRIDLLARDGIEISVDDLEWPEFSNAISSNMLTDGEGRLYVFPFTRGLEEPESGSDDDAASEGEAASNEEASSDESEPSGRAVDVYSPEGELIVAGRANGTWRYARGPYVYTLRRDPDSEEMLAYRYRLQLNR